MTRSTPTHTVGGGIDQTAIIGHAPEHRAWTPTSEWHPVILGDAVRIEALVTIDAGYKRSTSIGDRTLLMKKVHVGHDASIGADCEIAPGACIGGHVIIEDGVRIGMNAAVRPGTRVGRGARIGMGAVVIHDVPAGEVWAGNPARCIQHPATPNPIDVDHLLGA